MMTSRNGSKARASYGKAPGHRGALRKQPIGFDGVLRRSLMQLGVVRLTQSGVGLAVEKGEEGVAPAFCHRRHLMQRAARENNGAAVRRAVGTAAELRKDEIAAVVILLRLIETAKRRCCAPILTLSRCR